MDSDKEDFYFSGINEEEEEEEQTHVDTDEELTEDGGDEESYNVFPVSRRQQKNYTILKEEDIKQRQENDISTISNVLNVSRSEACALLCHYKWTVSSVHEEWFSDEERVRQSVGILENPPIKSSKLLRKFSCKICFESCSSKHKLSAACGHPFCTNCWKTYITMSINNDGSGCLRLKCPESSCPAIAGLDMIEFLASAGDKNKYYKYLLCSYVEDNKKRKWCPSPVCENTIEYEAGGCKNYDVICDCSHKFCWNCMEEGHRPVDCETVANWNDKNQNEAENTTWILAYTKACPKCKLSIEKNQGCNHMTCRKPCGFEFCWLCLGSWKEHKGSYNCNRYEEENMISKEEKGREMARKHLERYAHYYERWASNDKSRKIALADLNRAKNDYIEKLARVQKETGVQLKFVTEAWEQIVECRCVLKWSYAYGYYIVEDRCGKTRFFEYMQGEAENALERLHHCAEQEMGKYLKANGPLEDFHDFRSKLVNLTIVTRDFFENLVRALENNLSEIENNSTETASNSKKARKKH